MNINLNVKATKHYATFHATVCRNQLNALLRGWVFLVGSHERLLQTVGLKVA